MTNLPLGWEWCVCLSVCVCECVCVCVWNGGGSSGVYGNVTFCLTWLRTLTIIKNIVWREEEWYIFISQGKKEVRKLIQKWGNYYTHIHSICVNDTHNAFFPVFFANNHLTSSITNSKAKQKQKSTKSGTFTDTFRMWQIFSEKGISEAFLALSLSTLLQSGRGHKHTNDAACFQKTITLEIKPKKLPL